MAGDADGQQGAAEGREALMHSVRQLVEEQRYAAAIALLDSAAVQDSDGSAGALQQQRLICSILMHVQQREWWQVLGLPPSSKEKEVRIQVRKLARKVHPDKCSLYGAEAAFKAVCLAAAQATDAAGGEEGPTSDGSGVHWWEAWDKTGRFAARKRKRAEDRPLHEEEQAWREQLTLQSLQELREEVTRLQNGLLAKGGSDEKLTRHEKQQRLKHARSLLAERLQAEQGKSVAGGFLH